MIGWIVVISSRWWESALLTCTCWSAIFIVFMLRWALDGGLASCSKLQAHTQRSVKVGLSRSDTGAVSHTDVDTQLSVLQAMRTMTHLTRDPSVLGAVKDSGAISQLVSTTVPPDHLPRCVCLSGLSNGISRASSIASPSSKLCAF